MTAAHKGWWYVRLAFKV